MQTLKSSLQRINYKLYFSLIFLGLCPAIYMAIRTNFLGQLPGDYAYSIAGQLSWVSLIYEIIQEAIILPLFFFLGNIDRETFANRLRSGLCLSANLRLTFESRASVL